MRSGVMEVGFGLVLETKRIIASKSLGAGLQISSFRGAIRKGFITFGVFI